MHNPEQDAKRYRHRAEEFRALAEDAEPTPRLGYLHLAKAYDELAGRLDQFAAEFRAFVYTDGSSRPRALGS